MSRPYIRDRADSNNNPTDSQYNINYRQIASQTAVPAALNPVTTSSSSYDYWWPYPPGGITTTSSLNVISTATAFSSAPISSPASSSIASAIISTSNSSSSNTASTSQTMISINAMMTSQAASSTFTSYPKASQNQSLTTSNAELYLIPIFVVLGVIIGSVVAWIGWGCLTRKPRIRDFDGDEISGIKRMTRRPRRSELEVGPVYCPSLSEARDYPESTEKQPLSLSMFSWHALDVDDTKDGKERDYLVPPALPSKKLRTKSVGSSKHLSRAATTKTATSMSVYSQVGEQEQELCEEDDRISFLNDFESDYDPCSPRPGGKSIATATPTSSTRVVSVSRRRPTHTRADSDCRVNDAGGGRVGGPRDKKDDLRRSATSRTQGSTCTTQTGFRIVDGSPLPTPAISRKQSENVAGFLWGNNEPEDCGTSSRPGNRGRSKTNATSVSSDSYTTLPIRGSRSRSNSPVKKSVTTRSANKQRHVSTRDKAIEEYYGNALPQSPPQITSPKLNTSLCFTPPLN